MQSAFRANSREVLGGESTGRGREVHRDDWVLGVANEERRQARPKDLVNVDIVLVKIDKLVYAANFGGPFVNQDIDL